jgi:hypothetical protein
MRKYPTSILVPIVIFIMVLEPRAQIANGGFEFPQESAGTGTRGTPDGWAWASSIGLVMRPPFANFPPAAEGSQYVDIGNSPSFLLFQRFTNSITGTFTLRWTDSTAKPANFPSPYSITLRNASSNIVFTAEYDAAHVDVWRTNKVEFIAVAGDYILQLQSLGNDFGYDTLIDDLTIALESVPGKIVSGTVVNKVWSVQDSPIYVVGDVQVARLTIQAGVNVVMAGNFGFEVPGILRAIGEPNAPVVFTAGGSGWQGISFDRSQNGSELVHCVVEKSVNSGIRIRDADVTIKDCVIRDNVVSSMVSAEVDNVFAEAYGGGISTDSTMTLDGCLIEGNSALSRSEAGLARATSRGGGVYSTAPLTLLNCIITNNVARSTAASSGGGSSAPAGATISEGGGIWAGGRLELRNSLVLSNFSDANSVANEFLPSSARAVGAGVFIKTNSMLRNSIVARNRATAALAANSAPTDLSLKGGGLYTSADTTNSIENCTIGFNSPDGLFTDAGGTTTVVNSIVWGNASEQVGGSPTVSYSDVQRGYAGLGNIDRNPIFLSQDQLIIVPGSPCINAGSQDPSYKNLYFPPSIGLRSDIGAHGGPDAGARLRVRSNERVEVVVFGGVPGFTYDLQGSADLLEWTSVMPFSQRLGETTSFLEPIQNPLVHRFYRLRLAP